MITISVLTILAILHLDVTIQYILVMIIANVQLSLVQTEHANMNQLIVMTMMLAPTMAVIVPLDVHTSQLIAMMKTNVQLKPVTTKLGANTNMLTVMTTMLVLQILVVD
jgi:hypothetical protein